MASSILLLSVIMFLQVIHSQPSPSPDISTIVSTNNTNETSTKSNEIEVSEVQTSSISPINNFSNLNNDHLQPPSISNDGINETHKITAITLIGCGLGITACILLIRFKFGFIFKPYLNNQDSKIRAVSNTDCMESQMHESYINGPGSPPQDTDPPELKLEICDDVNQINKSPTGSDTRIKNKIQEYILRELKELDNYSHGRNSVYNHSVGVIKEEEDADDVHDPVIDEQPVFALDRSNTYNLTVSTKMGKGGEMSMDVFEDVAEPGSPLNVTNGIADDEFVVRSRDRGESSHDIVTLGMDMDEHGALQKELIDGQEQQQQEKGLELMSKETIGASYNSDNDVILDMDMNTKGFIMIEPADNDK